MEDVMTRHAKTVPANSLAAEAMHLMEQFRITALLVVDTEQHVVGALNVHDLMRAGVV
jgi:arabinose-5-phosphate isomerase